MALSESGGVAVLLFLVLLFLLILLPGTWPLALLLLFIALLVVPIWALGKSSAPPRRDEELPIQRSWGLPVDAIPCTIVLELRGAPLAAPERIVLERCAYCRRAYPESLGRCPHCGAPG